MTKFLHIAMLLTGFTLFVGCGVALYFAPPHLFINQSDCLRTVCIARFTELSRGLLTALAYGIPAGLLAMMYAYSQLSTHEEENPG